MVIFQRVMPHFDAAETACLAPAVIQTGDLAPPGGISQKIIGLAGGPAAIPHFRDCSIHGLLRLVAATPFQLQVPRPILVPS